MMIILVIVIDNSNKSDLVGINLIPRRKYLNLSLNFAAKSPSP